MASLISQTEKNNLENALERVYETFKTTYRVWAQPELTVISTPAQFNFIIGGYTKTQVENEPTYTDFEGIIHYLKPQEMVSYLAGQGRLDERYNETKIVVKIKCKEDGYLALKGSTAVEFDSRRFKIISSGRQHGLFNRQFYTILMEEII